jgi:hypothetical protein
LDHLCGPVGHLDFLPIGTSWASPPDYIAWFSTMRPLFSHHPAALRSSRLDLAAGLVVHEIRLSTWMVMGELTGW